MALFTKKAAPAATAPAMPEADAARLREIGAEKRRLGEKLDALIAAHPVSRTAVPGPRRPDGSVTMRDVVSGGPPAALVDPINGEIHRLGREAEEIHRRNAPPPLTKEQEKERTRLEQAESELRRLLRMHEPLRQFEAENSASVAALKQQFRDGIIDKDIRNQRIAELEEASNAPPLLWNIDGSGGRGTAADLRERIADQIAIVKALGGPIMQETSKALARERLT